MTNNRPGIFRIGTVTDDGETVVISGWGIGLCAARCTCHRAFDGQLRLHQADDGTLGLIKSRPCDCCHPWTAEELTAVIADLAALEGLPEVPQP